MRQTTRTRDQNAAGPFADAGPYAYDLPAVSDGGRPAPAPRRAWKYAGLSWKAGLVIFFVTIGSRLLNDLTGLPRLHCYMFLYCLATVFGYWDTPGPRRGFLPWALKVIGIFLNLFIALVTVPQSLRGLLPDSLAFGLPPFLFLLVFYWVPPLLQEKRTAPFWQWLLASACFAAFWGWGGPGFIK